ncbi:MAG: DUF5103 domain-containing protein, partial [Flavobacteriales bacterium]|nr:DUF5103 domain-containing protein [Flavobacteriales bacterium]
MSIFHCSLRSCWSIASILIGTDPLLWGQEGISSPDYFEERTKLTDAVYDPDIHTVQLFKEGFELSAPIIELNGDERLVLRFDDMGAHTRDLSYTLEHCTADWQLSDVSKGLYLNGAFSDLIPAPRQSFNTFRPFFHYTVAIPNNFIRPSRSGNYILKVFEDGDEEHVILTRRLMVMERTVQVDARVVASRNVEVRNIAHQVDLNIMHAGVVVQDPFSDIHVTVLQNMNWSDARTGLKPKFVRNNELIYDHPPEAEFMGGNEFRNFDLKNLRYVTQFVSSIIDGPELMESILVPQPSRNIRVYFDQPDLNGRYLVRNDDVDGDPLGADYTYVHFSLAMDEPLQNGQVYVFGGLSDMSCKKGMRMTWDDEYDRYYLRTPLKQGFYDYVYAFVPDGADVPDLTRLEGSHFQTENDYVILVYLTDHQLRTDR